MGECWETDVVHFLKTKLDPEERCAKSDDVHETSTWDFRFARHHIMMILHPSSRSAAKEQSHQKQVTWRQWKENTMYSTKIKGEDVWRLEQ